MVKQRLPTRWAFKHGAYYYRPHKDERALFDGKSWFRLADNYPDALRAFADRKELEMGDTLDSCIDRYEIEVLPTLALNTQRSYAQSLKRLRGALGHNIVTMIQPQLIYQYMDAVAKAHTMNVANSDLKVLKNLFKYAIRWGVITHNFLKDVSYFGVRDGLKKTRDRYVQDWELEEWLTVATPVQIAFAAITMLTPERKSDILQITLPDIREDCLLVRARKTGDKDRPYEWTPALKEAVDYALSIRKGSSMFLFTNRDGNCYVRNGETKTFDKSWKRSQKKAIEQTRLEEPFTRHDLRAKVGSDADSEERARVLLGHTTISMTRKHYRRRVELLKPAK